MDSNRYTLGMEFLLRRHLWRWRFRNSQDTCVIIPEIIGSNILTGGNSGREGSFVTFILGLTIGIVLLRYKACKN